MNQTAKRQLEAILGAETTFENAVGTALMEYRTSKEQIRSAASAYKDEQSYIDERLPAAQNVARGKIERAEQSFRKALMDNTTGLKSELRSAVNAPIPQAFTDRIAFYRTANLTPTRTEAEGLLSMAGKNPLAIRAVAKLLDDTGAPVRIESRAVEQYEADLTALEELAEMPLIHAPYECFTELVETMSGQPMQTKTRDGYRDVGHTWDRTKLLINGSLISGKLKDIAASADAWSADITFTVREREHAEAVAQAKKEAGEEYQPETEPASSARLEERGTSAVEIAAELGRETAKATNDAIGAYLK